MPGMTLPKCLDDLASIKMEHLYIKYDEADFLMDQEKILKAENLHIKANYFKPTKLFSKIEAKNVYLVIRFKFGQPKEDAIIPSPFVKHLFCKINYTTNLEEVFEYLNSGFPELETFEVETNWGISSLCSFETFNAAEKLSTSMKDCFRVIGRIESSGLRAKSKGMKAKTLLRVRLLMPSEDTTFFADKNAAKKLRETIVMEVEGQFGKIPENEDGEKLKEMSITLENGVKRFQKFIDHFLILESNF
uniref:Uncharacterized protein n=1 Tax=Panagrolaimus sp. ES5 TaxID=591445 RepID=A0AC34G9V1_9BILA